MLLVIPVCAFAGGERMDLRMNAGRVSDRVVRSRLALGRMKEKSKGEELQVKSKKKVESVKAVVKVKRFDNQRKRKTKRVVASQ